uniref:Uncharacterized protein n=1 Tax=viral metagenome TaxID=1070528 RepID=A0A6M3L350_9ZZZZ
MSDVWLVPTKGVMVRDPYRNMEPLPPEGTYKPWSGKNGKYWRRRLACGDVTMGSPPKPIKTVLKKSSEE